MTSPRLLLITAVLLAATGVFVLSTPPDGPDHPGASPNRSAVVSATPAPHPSPPARSVGVSPRTGTSSTTARPTTEPAKTPALPPHGEGIAGDRAIQQSLERAWPADLSPADEQQLRERGTALLRADATGIGRANWPDIYGDRDRAVAPAFATARFRVQAVIARRNGTAGQAVAHLVWAGTDRGGTFTDGRITDWYFTRTTTKKGAPAWTPQPQH
ncbi:hypothetical protein ACSYGO_07005 [Streptomyces krungchingensis]